MQQGKHAAGRARTRRTKPLALLLAMTLVFGVAVGGTLAWLEDSSDEIVNSFATSDITVTLAESENLNLQMIPGHSIAKDPTVTVAAGSVDCYVFVQLTESANFGDYMEYYIAEGWTALSTESGGVIKGVYYRPVTAENMGKDMTVLKNNQVTVKISVTKEMMLTAQTNKPTLTVTAYAHQLSKDGQTKFTPLEAWANVKPGASMTTE